MNCVNYPNPKTRGGLEKEGKCEWHGMAQFEKVGGERKNGSENDENQPRYHPSFINLFPCLPFIFIIDAISLERFGKELVA